MSQVGIVANFFRAVGLLLGSGAIVLLVMFGGSLFDLNRPPPDPSHPLSVQTYGIVGLIQNGAIGLSKMLGFLGEVGLWVGVLMTVVSVVLLIVAIILFVTGSGVAAHAGWARVVAAFFSLLVLLLSAIVMVNLPRGEMIVPGVIAAAALYTIWVLGWRYART